MEDSWTEYIDLISDASLTLHPENHASKFTNELPTPQRYLPGTKVGLVEFEFLHSWYNVSVEKPPKKEEEDSRYNLNPSAGGAGVLSRNSLTIFDFLVEHVPGSDPNKDGTYSLYGLIYSCEIKEGYYETFETLCEMLNKAVKNCGSKQVVNRDIFSYDPISMKFSYDLEGLWLTLFLRGDIVSYLGCGALPNPNAYVTLGMAKSKSGMYTYKYRKDPNDEKSPIIEEQRHFINPKLYWSLSDKKGPKDTFPHVGRITLVTTFAIYINVIESQITGDTYSDALRIIAINKRPPGTNSVIRFEEPYFLKLNKFYIPSISIEIRSLTGQLIDFKVGRTRLKLKFVPPSSST